jgi:hypothetical protein
VPAAVFEIILMPVWLYAKGFYKPELSSIQRKSAAALDVESVGT